ncbi:unnamed protein product [Closterium sp. NIES-65]|nr:unnamed protein product [Closterium sp. NIES-65]
MLKEAVGPFADDNRVSLEKKLASLSFAPLEDKEPGEASTATEGKEKDIESDAPASRAHADPVEEEEDEEDEDDGYLSDDPEERLDPPHPENSLYVKERARNPDAIEVLLKSVPVEISSDMVYKFLLKTPLEKRGHPPFRHGAAFHRVVDPVRGADTDKIEGLVKVHPEDNGLEKTLQLVMRGLRAHTREKKWIRATITHLEKEVEVLRHAVMQRPSRKRLQDRSIRAEAKLEAYLERDRKRLQVLADLNVELSGEVPSPYLTAKIRIWKKSTTVQEVNHRGVMYRGTREVLKAVEDHFGTAFVNVELKEEVDWESFSQGPRFSEDDAKELGRSWSEEEVNEAIASLPKGRSLGQDGLPAEFFATHWGLLGSKVMQFVHDFEVGKDLPDSLATSIMVLLHKKGDRDQLGNYWPITLLSVLYKPKGKVLAKGQHGFLPGRSLAEEVSVVVNAANNRGKDWLLLLVDFQKAYDTTQRRKLGMEAPGEERLSYIGYADDTSFLLEGEEQLKESESMLESFGRQSGLKVNCGKSVVLPLGCNRGKQAPLDLSFKWAEKEEPEWLLGIWIMPNGDAGPSWDKTYERVKEELGRWEAQYLTTMVRVAVVSCYVRPIMMFQAHVYLSPEGTWDKIRKSCHNFVYGGEATDERRFILWSAYLVSLPRMESGLGLADLKIWLDGLAVRKVGKLLAEPDGVRRWLAEEAAELPQGTVTWYAYPAVIKKWPGGSERWKAAAKAFQKIPFADLPDPTCRWEVDEEWICFNRKLMHKVTVQTLEKASSVISVLTRQPGEKAYWTVTGSD